MFGDKQNNLLLGFCFLWENILCNWIRIQPWNSQSSRSLLPLRLPSQVSRVMLQGSSWLHGALAGEIPSAFPWLHLSCVLGGPVDEHPGCEGVWVCALASVRECMSVCMGGMCVGERWVGRCRHLSSLLPAVESMALGQCELVHSPFTVGHTGWFMRDSFSAPFSWFLFISPSLQTETLDCPEFQYFSLSPFPFPLIP